MERCMRGIHHTDAGQHGRHRVRFRRGTYPSAVLSVGTGGAGDAILVAWASHSASFARSAFLDRAQQGEASAGTYHSQQHSRLTITWHFGGRRG